jgi:hypothetical protein
MLDKVRALPFAQALIALSFFLITATGQIQFDRPKTEKPLPNPSIVNAPRDELITLIKQILETREVPIDRENCDPTKGECTLVSKPVIFIKGIQTKSQLEHYAEVPAANVRNWSRGRYVLSIQVSPATPNTAQIGVYAKFEGMSDGVIGNEWVPLTSKGQLEDNLLRCIIDRIRGGDCSDIK